MIELAKIKYDGNFILKQQRKLRKVKFFITKYFKINFKYKIN